MNLRFEVVNSSTGGLARNFRVNPDSCDNHGFYEQYLMWMAYGDLTTGANTTHILLDEDSEEIVGFVTLRATSVLSEGEVTKGTPALEISVLAVNQKYEGLGFGRTLIDFSIHEAEFLHRNILGVENIVLMADPKSVGFYEKCGFHEIDHYTKVPQEMWNKTCVPMILRLGFGLGPSFVTDDDEEED